MTEAFVIRYLPTGALDPSFGSGGEIVTTFGAPRPLGTKAKPGEYERPVVRATQIAVDADGRPLIAGNYSERVEGCVASETPIALSSAPVAAGRPSPARRSASTG